MKNDSSRAYCNVCKRNITAKYSDLTLHSSSKKHSNADKTPMPEITKFLVENLTRLSFGSTTCIKLGLSFTNIELNYLTKMLKSTIDDSKTVSSLQMKRTKCSIIIKNVLGLYFHNNLIEEIGDGNCSLLLDESNDITPNKILGIAVIYFSKSSKKVISTFLNFITLKACITDAIVNALKQELLNRKLDLFLLSINKL